MCLGHSSDGRNVRSPGFHSTIGRAQEVPPIPGPGGNATLTRNDDGTELTYDISVAGIPEVSAAHFHNASAGENGGVAFGLEGAIEGDSWVSAGVWTEIPADMTDAIRNGEICINVHTADYGGGEIRGQVLGEGADFTASFGARPGGVCQYRGRPLSQRPRQ